MSRIAILGATSQIASDLIRQWATSPEIQLDLFARRQQAVHDWLGQEGMADRFQAAPFEDFGKDDKAYDAVINFVGVGDPAKAAAMGASILDITMRYDDMAMEYQNRFPQCRYLFLSSGAVYGSTFIEPASRETPSQISINDLPAQEFYAVAKLHAEARHRARQDMPVVDLRVFNIFSRTQDLDARFFITDVVRAVRDKTILKTSGDTMTRDFQHPSDFRQLVEAILRSPPANAPVDCYSRAEVDKWALLSAVQDWFGLRWEAAPSSGFVNATGAKPNYYSVNRRAADFGYQPGYSSLECLKTEMTAILG